MGGEAISANITPHPLRTFSVLNAGVLTPGGHTVGGERHAMLEDGLETPTRLSQFRGRRHLNMAVQRALGTNYNSR